VFDYQFLIYVFKNHAISNVIECIMVSGCVSTRHYGYQ